MPRKTKDTDKTQKPRTKAQARAYGEALQGLYGSKKVPPKFGVLPGGRNRLKPDTPQDVDKDMGLQPASEAILDDPLLVPGVDELLPIPGADAHGAPQGGASRNPPRSAAPSLCGAGGPIPGDSARHESDNRQPHSDVPEWREQSELVKWINLALPYCRGYIMTHGNEGERSAAGAQVAKMMGQCQGAHDLFIARPAMGHHGLFIEMKQNRRYRPSERATPTFRAQQDFRERMLAVGYAAHFAYGWEHGSQLVKDYFGIIENDKK